MTVLQQWLPAQDSPEVPVNENFKALEHMAVYAKNAATTTGLTWGYLGGRWGGFAVSAGTLTLAASSTLYLTVSRTNGVISVSSSDASWTNPDVYARVYKLTTGAATVTAVEDYRAGFAGVHGVSGNNSGQPGGGDAAPVVPDETLSRNVSLIDVGSYLRFTGAGAKTCTFDFATGFTTGQEVHIANRSANGNLTISATGILLNPPKGGTLNVESGDTVTVKFVSAIAADVFGSTEASA